MKIKIGVIFGGRSVEHEVSIISAIQTMDTIDKDKYTVIPIYISKKGIWYTGDKLFDIDNFKDMDRLLTKCRKIILSNNVGENTIYSLPQRRDLFSAFRKKVIDLVDVALPVLHGTNGEDGALQGLLELINIPYVGCNVISSAIGMDKITMKVLLKEANLPVVKYLWFYAKTWLKENDSIIEKIEKELKFPVIVKPANLGSSIGIQKANDRDELEDAVDLARSFSPKILVEKAITNLREINCSVLGDYENVQASVCEEPLSSSEILTFQDKYLRDSKTKGMSSLKRRLPADLPEETSNFIRGMAQKTFLALECNGVSRVDFLLDKYTEKTYINEINTIPGSLSFYLWEATGKSFSELIDELIQLALKRYREKENLIFYYDSNILSLKGKKGLKK